MRLRKTPRFRFIPNDIIPVRARLVQRIFKKLRDERCAETQDEIFIFGGGFSGQGEDGGRADGQVVAADKINGGLFDERPDGWGAEVGDFVFVCGGEVRAHAARVPGDDDAAASCGRVLVD